MISISQLKAIVFGLILFVTSFIGALTVNGVLMPVLFFSPRLFRRLFDYGIGLWEWQTACLVEKLIGMEVKVSGDMIQSEEQSVIIMNHRTCLDWLYFWSVLVRSRAGVWAEKIILKSALKHIPGAGWGMQAAGFLFLRRRWEEDKAYMTNMIDYLAGIDYKTHLLIFPEGTDFNAFSKQRSDDFAAKNGLDPMTCVLHPRTAGFSYVVSQLQKHWKDVIIYDVTIAYSSTFPQNERELVQGILPGKVHFQVRRYGASEVPRTTEDLTTWCQQRWLEKEHCLEYFYKNKSFPEGRRPTAEAETETTGVYASGLWLDLKFYAVIAFWVGCVALAISGLLSSWLFRVAFFLEVAMFVGLCLRGSGFELAQAAYFQRFFCRAPKQD